MEGDSNIETIRSIGNENKNLETMVETLVEDEGFLDNPPISIYSYASIMNDKYKVFRSIIGNRRYKCRHWNGFMQLLVEPFAEAYFFCQVENEYSLPDWKFHVSVNLEDYEKTWDILMEIFFKYKLVALKMQIQGPSWTKLGRGFTIYIPTKISIYEKYLVEYQWSQNGKIQKSLLGEIFEEEDRDWCKVYEEIEEKLKSAGIKSDYGCEKGDFALGKYVTMRNESFSPILENGNWKMVYPPDEHGWNPARHSNVPLLKETIEIGGKCNTSKYFHFLHIDLPLSLYKTWEFDKMCTLILKYVAGLKEKPIEMMQDLITQFYLCASLVTHPVNQIKSVDFMFDILLDKKSFGKDAQARSLLIKYLIMLAKTSHSLEVREYTSKKFAVVEASFEKKKNSQAKRIYQQYKKKTINPLINPDK